MLTLKIVDSASQQPIFLPKLPKGIPLWKLSKEEVVGKKPRDLWKGPVYDVWSRREDAWELVMNRAVSEGRITPEAAEAQGYTTGSSDSGKWGGRWRPLPKRLFHTTTQRNKVLREGLRTRRQLHLKMGCGLGGGSDDCISLSDDAGIAWQIKRGMLQLRRVARGEFTAREMLAQAVRGDGAKRPYARQALEHTGGGKLNLSSSIYYNHTLPKVRRYKTAIPVGHVPHSCTPTDKGIFRNAGKPWAERWHKTFRCEPTKEEGIRVALSLYGPWLRARMNAGGPIDPLFFSIKKHLYAVKKVEDFAVLEFRPCPGAKGLLLSQDRKALREWVTMGSRAVRLVKVDGKPVPAWVPEKVRSCPMGLKP